MIRKPVLFLTFMFLFLARYSSQGWSLNETSIFALVEAFVQRCKDLIEVSNCNVQYEIQKCFPLGLRSVFFLAFPGV